MLVKDNFDTHDLPTRGGSVALLESVPPDDPTMVATGHDAGLTLEMREGLLIGLAVCFPLCGPAGAAAQDLESGTSVSSVVNVVGQSTDRSGVRSELVASFDLFADVRLGSVRLHAYLEANTTPRTGGISASIPGANTDAGTALGADGAGRIQLSELRVAWPASDRAVVHAGLMDLTGFLDVSRISNDENLYFLGQPFVNNPTILFPDYTLGGAFVARIPKLPGGRLALAISSSHGLADLPEASYGELFDLGAGERGVFAASRLRWETPSWAGALGGWASSASGPDQSSPRPRPERGLYAVLERTSAVHSVSTRFGTSSTGAESERFFGVTYLGRVGSNAVGLGVARTASRTRPTLLYGEHVEGFLRRSLHDRVYLTLSAQWLSGGLLPDSRTDGGAWVIGFRASATL